MDEEWRDIAGYDGLYQVSNLGRVRSTKGRWRAGKVLKGGINRDGYSLVTLFRPGESKREHKQFKVHRLVFQTFVGLLPDGCRVTHKNGDRADNRAENLEYYTLTIEQVGEIRRLYAAGFRQAQIIKALGVPKASVASVSRVVRYESWKNHYVSE